MPILTIDARDWFRGASTTDELADGGFSPLSKGINLFASPGLLLPGQAPTDTADTPAITQGIFGWAATPFSGFFGYALGSNATDDGKVYAIDATGLIGSTGSYTSKDYQPNISDIITYKGSGADKLLITSTIDIAYGNDNTTLAETWWTSTLGLSPLGQFDPHHMCEFGGIIYIADGRYIHSWDGTTGTYNALDLPQGFVIDDIVVFNNAIYITASLSKRFNSSVAGRCYIFTWDGFSATFQDQIPIEERIITMVPFGGTLFVTTQKYFGYFTGSTVLALYPLSTPVYKYQATITNDRLYMAQGADVLCYGNPIVSRPKFFSFPLKHSSTLVGLHCIQTGSLVYSTGTKIGAWSDVNGSNQTGGIFYDNRKVFGGQVRIRSISFEHEALASGSSQTMEYIDDTQSARAVGTLSFASFGAIAKHRFDIFNKAATLTSQIKITFGATPNKGIRRIHISYEPSELRENK